MFSRSPHPNFGPRRHERFVQRDASPAQKSRSKEVIDRCRKGVVANYNKQEGYGFVVVVEEENRKKYDANLFVHHSSMSMEQLKKGDFVEFDVAVGRKGFEAFNLKVSESIPPPDCDGKYNVEPNQYRKENEDNEAGSRVGEVIRFNPKKRFGIIRCQKTGMTVLAHHSKLKAPLTELVVGQTVKFKMTVGPKESIACEVEVISDAPDSQNSSSGSPQEESKTDSKSETGETKPKQKSEKKKTSKSKTETSVNDKKSSFNEAVSSELTCSMCLDLLSEDSLYTPCEHNFCRDCIEPWIKRKTFCPVCKAEVQTEDLQPVPRVIRNLIKTASV